jgi:hypothetical protein
MVIRLQLRLGRVDAVTEARFERLPPRHLLLRRLCIRSRVQRIAGLAQEVDNVCLRRLSLANFGRRHPLAQRRRGAIRA